MPGIAARPWHIFAFFPAPDCLVLTDFVAAGLVPSRLYTVLVHPPVFVSTGRHCCSSSRPVGIQVKTLICHDSD